MAAICLYLHLHCPRWLKQTSLFEVGKSDPYVSDSEKDRACLKLLAEKCYLPVARKLDRLLDRHGDRFSIAIHISGLSLELWETQQPDLIHRYRSLLSRPEVECLASPYYHSNCFPYMRGEFERQLALHKLALRRSLKAEAHVVANTGLLYNNYIGYLGARLGYKGMIIQSPDDPMWSGISIPPFTKAVALLPQSLDLSYTLEYGQWETTHFNQMQEKSDPTILGLNVHRLARPGALADFENWVSNALKRDIPFFTPSHLIHAFLPEKDLDIPGFTGTPFADGKGLANWPLTPFQAEAVEKLYQLGQDLNKKANSRLWARWGNMQNIDHLLQIAGISPAHDIPIALPFPPLTYTEAHRSFLNQLADFQLCN